MKAPAFNAKSGEQALRAQRGVTLIELIITMVIISIAVVAVVTAISGSVGRSADPIVQGKSAALAQTYLDEILTKRFAESTPTGGVPPATTNLCLIGPDGSETRATFNDVDDYHNLSDAPPNDQAGGDLPGYAGYRVDVAVDCDGTGAGLATNEAAKRIRVTVTSPDGAAMDFSVFRANF